MQHIKGLEVMLLRYAAVAQIPQMNFGLSPTNLDKYLVTYEDRKRKKSPQNVFVIDTAHYLLSKH